MATSDSRPIQRDVLPVADLPRSGLVTYDAKDPDTAFPPIEELRPPAGAPNVLVVLIDDVGFGGRGRRAMTLRGARAPEHTPAGMVARPATPREARREVTTRLGS